jgi:hypothetical protein
MASPVVDGSAAFRAACRCKSDSEIKILHEIHCQKHDTGINTRLLHLRAINWLHRYTYGLRRRGTISVHPLSQPMTRRHSRRPALMTTHNGCPCLSPRVEC